MIVKQYREDKVWGIAKSRADTKEAKRAIKAVETHLDDETRRALVSLLEHTSILKKVRDLPYPLDEVEYPRENYIRLQYAGQKKPPSERTVKIHRLKGRFDEGIFFPEQFVATDGTGPAKTFMFSRVLDAWDAETGEVISNFEAYVMSAVDEDLLDM